MGEHGTARVRIALPSTLPGKKHIWNQYTLRVIAGPEWNGTSSPRDAFKEFLTARQIGNEIYYPRPMHLQECFPPAGPERPSLPVCEQLAAECISVPIYPELNRAQQDAVIAAIADFLKQ